MAILTVYCGVSEGIMAGVNVVANNRAEFFLVGKPLEGERTLEYCMRYVFVNLIYLTQLQSLQMRQQRNTWQDPENR